MAHEASNDEKLLQSIFTTELILRDKSAMRTVIEDVVYCLMTYQNELGSGLSYLQWFRWSSPDNLARTLDALGEVKAAESAKLCQQAIDLAFPNGVLSSSRDYQKYVYDLETGDEYQDVRPQLVALARQQLGLLGEFNSQIAAWVRDRQSCDSR